MSVRPERLLLAALLAFSPVLASAQERPVEEPAPAADAQAEGATAAEKEEVTPPGVTEEVRESQPPAPNEQGMLQTETLDEDAEEAKQDVSLYVLLSEVRRAPPGLDGQPIERPNPLASEPTLEMDPMQPLDAYLFPEDYIE